MSPLAVVFGAGCMAGGLIGDILEQAGFRVQFVVRRDQVADAINRHQGYALSVAGDPAGKPRMVSGCSALHGANREQVAAAVARADLVFTAVGIDNLAAITPSIADGLFLRSLLRGDRPLNVIACENLPGAGAYLRHQVLSAGPPASAWCIRRIAGFSAAVTHRVMTGGQIVEGVLTFAADSDAPLIVDRSGLKGVLPPLPGAVLTDDFAAAVMLKFFTLNCAQAVAAYLGYAAGCTYIHEAVCHPRIGAQVRAALNEACAALAAEYPHLLSEVHARAQNALHRLADPGNADTIARVGRDPRRKLSSRERLLGPARLARRHGLPTAALTHATAAALTYDAPADSQAQALQDTIATDSIDTVLTEDCGLLPHEDLARAIKHEWRLLRAQRRLPAVTAHGTSPLTRSVGLLQDAMRAMVADFSQTYERSAVLAALNRVAGEEYQTA